MQPLDVYCAFLHGRSLRIPARNSPLAFIKIAENLWFRIFYTHKSSDESSSKAQFNLYSLGENTTGYRAENMKFVSADETSRIVHIYLYCFFIPSW